MGVTEASRATVRGPGRRTVHVWWLGALLAIVIGVGAAFAFASAIDRTGPGTEEVGHAVPAFTLPPLQGRPPGLSSADLHGRVTILNVFASWCPACRAEHRHWMRVAATGTVPISGLNYKDKPANSAAWLKKYGDPYGAIGSDRSGRVAIDLGVYGVPETFVIDREGRIAYTHIGPVDRQALEETILPLVRRLQRQRPRAPRPGNQSISRSD